MGSKFFVRETYAAMVKCRDCDWGSETFNGAEHAALRHIEKTGHAVNVERGEIWRRSDRVADSSAPWPNRRFKPVLPVK